MGDCKPTELCKELEKVVQQKDTTTLEANNAKLADQVADLEVEIAKKDEEIRQLHVQSKEGLDRMWDFIGNPCNVVNKTRLFNNEVKTKGQLFVPKIVTFLVEFGWKIEATLVEMWKLLPGPQSEPFWLPILSPRGTPLKNWAMVELKTPHQHRPNKKLVVEAEKVVTLTSAI